MSETSFPPGYLEEYSGNKLLRVGIAFIPLEILFVSFRYGARYVGKLPWRLDDYLVLPSLFFNLALLSCGLAMVIHAGVGYHIAALEIMDPAKILLWAKFLFAIPLLYVPAVTLPKLAILSLYLKIFVEVPYRRACYAIGGVLLASAVANILVGIFECTPIEKFWDETIKYGHCININAYFRWAASVPNLLTDIAMLIIPLPVVWKLKMTTNAKIGLSIMFLTGSIGFIMAIVRFIGFLAVNAIVDGTWSSVDLMIWTCAEPGFYLIAACLPTMRPLARFFADRTADVTGLSSRRHKYGNLTLENEQRDIEFDGMASPLRDADSSGTSESYALSKGGVQTISTETVPRINEQRIK